MRLAEGQPEKPGMGASDLSRPRIRTFRVLDSTQDYVLRQLDSCGEYEVVVAEEQTSGRGRGGNNWYSDAGCLTFSFKVTGEKADGMMLRASSAIKKALECMGVPSLLLKWPNDLYVSTQDRSTGAAQCRKIAGVLVNSVVHKGVHVHVIGVGLNLHGQGGIYTSVEEATGVNVGKEAFLAQFVREMQEAVQRGVGQREYLEYAYVVLGGRRCEIVEARGDSLVVRDRGSTLLVNPAKYSLDYATHVMGEKTPGDK